MNMQKNLGAAEIIISIDNQNGIVVRHGDDKNLILAQKNASDCTREDWDKLWFALELLGVAHVAQ
jgi:hypothetical protein